MKDVATLKFLRKQQFQSLQELVLLWKAFVLTTAAQNMTAHFHAATFG